MNKFYTIICDNDERCIGIFSSKEKALQGFREYFDYRKSTLIGICDDGYIRVNHTLTDFVLLEFELNKI